MEYGANILSKQPADWTVTSGSISNSGIVLNASGVASIPLTPTVMKSIPESLKLSVIAEPLADTYDPTVFATLKVVLSDDSIVYYTVPLLDTGNGICTVTIPTTEASYKECLFYFTAGYRIAIKDWSLSAPLVEETEINLDEVREEIPKLLSDYNTYTLTVSQKEEVIALISARLLENTDVSGHLQITFVASAACVVTLRIKDNDGTELFAPILYNVNKGRSSIGVPHAYLKRLMGMHTFAVTAQCTTGTLTFYTRSVMYTIDAGYLAKRVMDTGYDVRDIAICQLPGETSPSSIYAVGIDPDGMARVRYRAYSENAAVVWEPAFSLPAAKAAAIEFDGAFVRHTGDAYYTLECHENPLVFWVDLKNDLYVQTGSDETTRIRLASGVSAVSAVRGFKSELYVEQDQGLIVAYLIGGVPYYRNYCRQSDGSYMWEYEKDLSAWLGTNLVNIQVHRLNDYRVGFIASSSIRHTWVISSRTYVGAAFPAEQVSFHHAPACSMALYPAGETPPTVTAEGSVADDHMTMYLTCNLPVVPTGSFDDNFLVSSSSTTYVSVKHMQVIDGVLHMVLASKPAKGILYLIPKLDRLRVYWDNRGYLRVPDTVIRFEFGDKIAIAEQVSFQYGMSGKITLKPIMHYQGVVPAESISFEYGMSARFTPKPVSTYQGIVPAEAIAFKYDLQANFVPAYVGTAPV